jgi:hypothetical protein
MVNNKYDCNECANKSTPICAECGYRILPGGDITKPTHYVKFKRVPLLNTDDLQADITSYISDLINSHSAIPIKVVMLYNKLVSKED